MRDFLKPAIIVILIFAVAAVLVNDLGQVAFAQLRAQDVTQNITAEAIRVYQQTGSANEAGLAAVAEGKKSGVDVYGFDYKDNKITVWTKIPVGKTIVLWKIFEWYPQFATYLTAKNQYTDSVR